MHGLTMASDAFPAAPRVASLAIGARPHAGPAVRIARHMR